MPSLDPAMFWARTFTMRTATATSSGRLRRCCCHLCRGRLEPRVRRLAPVARAEARWHLRRARPAEGLAGGGPPVAWRATGAGDRDIRRFPRRTGGSTRWARGGGTEYLMAFDAATGKKAVGGRARPPLRQRPGDGPRATPTVDGDRLYTFGASGDMSVVDAATGKVFWKMNLLEQVRRLEHPVGA